MDMTFLGTGGGRFVIQSQRRYSGGVWLDIGPKILLDPGPGSLIRALHYGKKPDKLDAVLVSHGHIDHYNDTGLIIEAMTHGMNRKHGLLVINKNAVDYISDYHKEAVDVIVPNEGDCFNVQDIKVEAIPTYKHADGIGFKFFTDNGIITFTSDTGYSEEMMKNYRGSRILVLNVMFPDIKDLETHLNTSDAIKIINDVRPELAIMQHFGMTMLNAVPEREAKKIEAATGVRIIAARDGMVLDIDGLDVSEKEMQLKLNQFSEK